ncbi:hypothetical protein MKW98_011473 [Papaver atlanticum]|uniref:R13L1/DRL21-like LRR repeat region domain-containing protein n=1 Tax=Papaver atlanticum TaxID=357466 RepID=A0AAD4RWS1_9MAGN|nr:hypothetical protein MKW98_011473 [Papaver atlanticum]
MITDNTIGEEEDISRLVRVSFASRESHELSQLPTPLAKVKKLRALISTASEFIDNSYGFTPDVALPDRVNSSNSLKELGFLNCGLNSCLDLRGFNSLRMLLILFLKSQECVSGIEHIINKKSGMEYLPKLETLEIGSFSEDLEPFPFPGANIEGGGGNYFPSLCELTLRGGGKLKCLPDQIQYITSLRCLRINVFNSLVALPEWLGNLTSLRELVICDCENVKYLPSQEQMLRLTSLRKLSIHFCQVLIDRCKQGGEEAYKISPEVRHQTLSFDGCFLFRNQNIACTDLYEIFISVFKIEVNY